ncbi:MAG: GNAT family N-acetyltransferase [Taibaiella sp.]|jgi:RimJ/RimL family protein N-acetyltransferase
MPSSKTYLFTSTRLGFRNWTVEDVEPMATINKDPAVMEHFPATQSWEETEKFISRMQDQLTSNGFCYYAVDRLDTHQLIGFTGLSKKDFESDFTPCVDIGWRFGTQAWNKGFATEAAKRCLQHGFQQLDMERIVSIAPQVNAKSIAVMEKAGMKFERTFEHPLLANDGRLRDCVLYSYEKKDFKQYF